LTVFLLAIILCAGPLILGAMRLWIELPLLGAVALLLVIQGLRLTASPLPNETRRIDAIDFSVVLFVLYAVVRWLTSPAEYFSRIEVLDVVAYAGIFFTCRYGMANRRHCLALLLLLVMLGVGETAFGYYLSHHSDPTEPAAQWLPFGPAEQMHIGFFPRWVGTYASSDHYACLLVIALGAALALGSFSKLSWPFRIVLFYAAALMMIGLMYSASRGSLIAFVAAVGALVIFGLRHGTMRWWVPVCGALIFLLFSAFLFSLSPLFRHRIEEGKNVVTGGKFDKYERVQLAWDGLRMAHDHPVFGTGPGTFVFVHPRYQDKTFEWEHVLAHDDYLNCLDDYGLVGLALALFFVAAVTLKFFQPLWVDNRWQDRALVATGFAAWVGVLIDSWVDYNLHVPANALLLFALTGLAMGRIKMENGPATWSTISLLRCGRWLGWGVVAASLVYGAEIARTAISNGLYETALVLSESAPIGESVPAAEQALTYDSGNEQALMLLGDLERDETARQTDPASRKAEGEKALDAYARALRANSLDDAARVGVAMTLDLLHRYPEALTWYRVALAEQPHNGRFWIPLGDHFQAQGLWQPAEESYLQASKTHLMWAEGEQAERQLRTRPEMKGIPVPPPEANPLVSSPEESELAPKPPAH
jgi:tetratricopeptide (TPR) repeat protein